ncbi:MAG: serine/threonine-protein kinase [Trueperaceae bacterium]|nr:serine/threonine-protein kinase [Trueperaceae bacterium]
MSVGDVIGRRLATGETVLREIGRGALARVYLVSDGTSVRALKLLPIGREGRAEHEHRVAHGLDHPCVGHVDARLEFDGRPGLLLPYVPGRRLLARSRVRRDLLAYLHAFGDLLDALAYLRDRGVVHRDVKPENVLVDRHGRARLIDFDLALRVDERERAPVVAGTPAYLSPEQGRGEPATYAADLYAAGVLLHTALTGEAPVEPERSPRPSDLDPTLAAADALVLGLLAAEPEERLYQAGRARPRLDALLADWEGAAAS